MKKFTIVVPTMWQYPDFIHFMNDLVEYDFIDEIIIINNNVAGTPTSSLFQNPKVNLLNYPMNILVNPAFNIGVRLSNNENICIINDDIIFDIRIFQHVSRIDEQNRGVIGMCPGLEEYNQPKFSSGKIQIIPWKKYHTFGFGSVMFVVRSHWQPIPPGLKLYFGDNWIFDTCLNMGLQNYIIVDSLHYTPYATTVKTISQKQEILVKENDIFKDEFNFWVNNYLSQK